MAMCKPKYCNIVNNIKLHKNDYTIEQVNKIKALGIYLVTTETAGGLYGGLLVRYVSKTNYWKCIWILFYY